MFRLLLIALTLLISASATAQVPEEFEPVGKIRLADPDGGEARGRLVVFASKSGEIAFNIQARELEPSRRNEAYGLWLVGGGRSRFLGFTPPVANDGKLAASGPRDSDAKKFSDWLARAHRVVLAVEMKPRPKQPGEVALRGDIDRAGTRGRA